MLEDNELHGAEVLTVNLSCVSRLTANICYVAKHLNRRRKLAGALVYQKSSQNLSMLCIVVIKPVSTNCTSITIRLRQFSRVNI